MTDQPQEEVLPATWLQEVYPDATSLFGTWLKPIEEVKDSCLVVLDTNVLLTPYTIGPKSIDQLRTTYRHLIESDRLRIPGQVAREFAKNRAQKIEELFQQLTRKQNSLPRMSGGRYPLLEPVPAYERVIELEAKLDEQQKEYKKAVSELIEHVRAWVWNDPVSELYSELFKPDVVVDLKHERKSLEAERRRRYECRIPPGYKDTGKEDQGIGDFLIWKTILKLGEETGKPLLFVSGDEKGDWWHRSEGQALYPRFELAEEYRRISKGSSFHMVRFSAFLDLLGVEPTVVAEVRQEEADTRVHQRQTYFEAREQMRQSEAAVLEWARHRYSAVEVTVGERDAPDILIVDEDDENVGIAVLMVRVRHPIRVLHRIREVAYRGHWYTHKHVLTVFAIALVTEDKESAAEIARFLDKRRIDIPPTHIHVGFLEDDRFKELEEVRI